MRGQRRPPLFEQPPQFRLVHAVSLDLGSVMADRTAQLGEKENSHTPIMTKR